MGIRSKIPGIIDWVKGHIKLSVLVGLAIIYIGYELLSSVFVYSRDAYVTTDLIGLAPEGFPVEVAPRPKLHVDENGEDGC